MDDVISRQAAIDEIKAVYEWHDTVTVDRLIQHFKALPTVDAVPVVRCRDCEHKDRESGFCHGRGWPMQLVPDDGFCDRGARKGGQTS